MCTATTTRAPQRPRKPRVNNCRRRQGNRCASRHQAARASAIRRTPAPIRAGDNCAYPTTSRTPPPRTGACAKSRQRPHRDPGRRHPLQEPVLRPVPLRQRGDHMQTGRDPRHLGPGKVLLQRRYEGIAPFPVRALAPTQMPVVVAAFHEPREELLVEGGMPEVHRPLPLDDLVGDPLRYEEPAQPQPGRERLADGPRVGDPLGIEPLQGAHGSAVVPELPVVVVLDHQPVDRPRPVEEFGAAARGVGDPGGELVRWRGHHRPYAGGPQPIEIEALVVQGQRYGGQAGRGVHRAVFRAAGVLDADVAHPARVEDVSEQRRRLRDPGDDHQPFRIRDHTPAPREELRQCRPQPGQPARIRVAEGVMGELREHRALGGGPGGTREQRQVGGARPEVGPGAGRARSEVPRARVGGPGGTAHPGPGPAAAAQIPLRGQLLVRLRDEAPRHPEVGREITARRQPRPRDEQPRADRRPQRLLKRTPTRACRCVSGRKQ